MDGIDPEGSTQVGPVDPDDRTHTLPGPSGPCSIPRTIGRLELGARLGEGGMGVVLAAHDRALGREVAVKLIRRAAVVDELEERRRLLREARAMARLSHPNVVEVYDAGTVDGHVYLSMELVRGQTLKQWLRAQPRSWPEILDVFVRAGQGLAAAHRSTLVHRDFKPSNVLVSRDGRVLVTDFGLARSIGRHESAERTEIAELLGDEESSARLETTEVTASGIAVGTPAYMPPEQHMRGVEVDARADQYALCAALYEALLGVRPFLGDSIADLYFAKLRGEIEPPGPAARRLPRGLLRVLVRGLQPHPSQRWPSMEVLLRRLRAASSRRRRGGRLAWVGAASVAVLGLVVGTAWMGSEVAVPCAEPIAAAAVPQGLTGLEAQLLEAEGLVDAARYDHAAAMAAAIALEGRGVEAGPWRARALVLLGEAELGRGHPAAARRHLTDALHEAEARGADATVVRAASTLAVVEAAHRGRPQDGARWVRHANARLARMATDEELRARVAHAHGVVLRGEGDYPQAAQMLERAVHRADASGRVEAQTAMRLRHLLANALSDLGHHRRAVALLERTLDEARRLLGSAHPEVATLCFDLSLALQGLGRWEEVEQLRREALELFERSLGPRHPLMVVALRGLGDAMLDTGRPLDGESYYRRALSVLDRGLAGQEPDHPRRVQLIERIAQAQARRGQPEAALRDLRRAIAMARRLDDRQAEYRVRRVLLWHIGLAAGDAFHREADALGRDVRRRPDPLPAGQREDLALWAGSLHARGRRAEAAAIYRELVQCGAGPSAEQRAVWALALGRVLEEAGQPDEARAEVRRAKGWLAAGSPRHSELEAWLADAEPPPRD